MKKNKNQFNPLIMNHSKKITLLTLQHFVVVLLLMVLSAANLALASSEKNAIVSKTLANGVKIIVKEDHRAPTVAHLVWYKVGSVDEPTGKTGISHILEHMMFKGTKTVPAGEFSKRVAQAGGRENAFTSYDNTTYFQQIPHDKLREMMVLEADRMRNLVIDEALFIKERAVVAEERRWRTDDQPTSLFWERLQAQSYTVFPYRHPVIGWMHDIQNTTAEDLRQWYARHYHPQNATVVVVGAVQAEQVLTWAQETYGAIEVDSEQDKKAEKKALPIEPKQQGQRRIIFRAAAHLPVMLFLYQAPALKDVNQEVLPYALEVLAMILDGHSAARLNQELVKKTSLATSVGVGYDMTRRGPSQFIIEASPPESKDINKSLETLEKAIRAQINKLIKEGVSEEELQRAKRQIAAQYVYKLDSIMGQAMEIGGMEIVGLGYGAMDDIQKKLQAVTAADVQMAAQEILIDDQLTLGILHPTVLSEEEKIKQARASANASRLIR